MNASQTIARAKYFGKTLGDFETNYVTKIRTELEDFIEKQTNAILNELERVGKDESDDSGIYIAEAIQIFSK